MTTLDTAEATRPLVVLVAAVAVRGLISGSINPLLDGHPGADEAADVWAVFGVLQSVAMAGIGWAQR